METLKLLGPPGTGKTFTLLDLLDEELRRGVPPERIAFLTFTVAARREAVGRVLDKFDLAPEQLKYFRTLHSIAYRTLGVNRSGMITGARELAPLGELLGLRFSDGGLRVGDDTPVETFGFEGGDRMLAFDHFRRHNMMTVEEAHRRWPEDQSFYLLKRFCDTYETWKRREGLRDFTDLLQEADVELPVDVVFVDEAQDLSRLQWRVLDRFSRGARRLYLGGDDDQCQPPGTMVRTTEGPVPIQYLEEGQHSLVSYDREGGRITGKRRGYAFRKGVRPYQGPMLTIEMDDRSTQCTPNHRWLTRWRDEAKNTNAVYLMRRGTWWRVGWCQLVRSDGAFHLGVRARQEKADEAWVLAAGLSREDASVLESLVAAKYGISTALFEEQGATPLYTQERLDAVFQTSGDRTRRAMKVLRAFGREIEYPFWSGAWAQSRQGGSNIVEVRAANLLPEVMLLPRPADDDRSLEWCEFSIDREWYDGPVYSLDVDKHELYFADGMLTHNSIFSWAGASPEAFIERPGAVRVLDQSYRVPAAVHRVATDIVRPIRTRMEKTWRPRDTEGRVDLLMDEEYATFDREGSYLVLYRTHYLGRGIEEHIRTLGLPYSKYDRPAPGAEFGRPIITWERLRKGRAIQVRDVRKVYEAMTAGTGFARGALRRLQERPGDEMVTLDVLRRDYGLVADGPWYEVLQKIRPGETQYLRNIIRNHGPRALTETPRIRLSSIHAAKGAEADHVILLTDPGRKALESIDVNPDDERRVFYVGVTRAKQTLTLVGVDNPLIR